MPELPEVETVRRTLWPHIQGRSIEKIVVHQRSLRVPVPNGFETRLAGKRFLNLTRRAKYLLFSFDGGEGMLIHLGMSGILGLVPVGTPRKKHDHVRFCLDNGMELRFNDPRRFGRVEACGAEDFGSHPTLAHLGPEPVADDFDAQDLADHLHAYAQGKSRPVKTYIMDATVVVGVGNIYASEALFKAGIRPQVAAGKISKARWLHLAAAIQETLTAAISQGGTTLRDFRNIRGEAGYFAISLKVYGRAGEPCPDCSRPIKKVVMTGRSTFYCGTCQR